MQAGMTTSDPALTRSTLQQYAGIEIQPILKFTFCALS